MDPQTLYDKLHTPAPPTRRMQPVPFTGDDTGSTPYA